MAEKTINEILEFYSHLVGEEEKPGELIEV